MARCVHCWIAIPVTQQYQYNAINMGFEIISVLEEWIARQIINEDYLCQECVSLLIHESNNRNEYTIGERQFGHDSVCVCCGISIARRTGRHSCLLNYGDAEWIYIANLINLLEMPSNAQARNACWLLLQLYNREANCWKLCSCDDHHMISWVGSVSKQHIDST